MRSVRFLYEVLDPLFVLAIILLAIFPSCAPRRAEISLDTLAVDAERLIAMVREQANRVSTLQGRGTVTFETPAFGGSAAFELSLRKPDSLLVLFEGPFGIDVGTLFLSKERFLVYNSVQNLAITGVPYARTIRSVIPFDLTVEQILAAFSGAFQIPGDPALVRVYTVDDGRFFLSLTCGTRICNYWIDNRFLQVVRYEILDADGHLRMQATSSSFTEDGDASAPRHIVVLFPEDRRSVSVYYTSLTLNPSDPSFAYTLPEDVRTIIH
jgi:hypothetical protein